jgi:NAD(P)-dependent dehydrogenase (short-subunit alcohol dehydrogenase family)
MPGRIEGKVAIITGGGSGIGRACAVRFAAEGAMVCAADVNLEGAAETVHAIEQAGGKALALQVDTTDEAANEEMVRRCVEAFGAVDLLVAAAGIGGARPADGQPVAPVPIPAINTPMENIHRVIDINLFGVWHSNRAVIKWQLANRHGGSIVNIASVAAKYPLPGGAYSVSKAGVWMLTKVLASELATTGIRVNAIGPGFIETPMTAAIREDEARSRWALALTPMGRYGQPAEIANTALFLASDEASYFTGEILHPSGGMFVG